MGDERLNTADMFNYQIQNITFYAAGQNGNGTMSQISEFYNRSFALTFVSTLNESFTTIPIMIDDGIDATGGTASITDVEIAMGAAIELALQALPNKVITNVNVNVSFGYETRFQFGTSDTVTSEDLAFMHMDVEFVGDSVMGPQNLLIPETDKCWDGWTSCPRRRHRLRESILISPSSPRSRLLTTTTTNAAAVASATTIAASASASRATPARPARPRLPWSNKSTTTTHRPPRAHEFQVKPTA